MPQSLAFFIPFPSPLTFLHSLNPILTSSFFGIPIEAALKLFVTFQKNKCHVRVARKLRDLMEDFHPTQFSCLTFFIIIKKTLWFLKNVLI